MRGDYTDSDMKRTYLCIGTGTGTGTGQGVGKACGGANGSWAKVWLSGTVYSWKQRRSQHQHDTKSRELRTHDVDLHGRGASDCKVVASAVGGILVRGRGRDEAAAGVLVRVRVRVGVDVRVDHVVHTSKVLELGPMVRLIAGEQRHARWNRWARSVLVHLRARGEVFGAKTLRFPLALAESYIPVCHSRLMEFILRTRNRSLSVRLLV